MSRRFANIAPCLTRKEFDPVREAVTSSAPAYARRTSSIKEEESI